MTGRGLLLMAVLFGSAGVTVEANRERIEVIIFRGGDCDSWREALATVEQAARELRVDAQVRVVEVRDTEEARRLSFHGSPSVVVNGVDVEGPEVEQRPASFG